MGASTKLNADCIIHATLEEDKATLKILYSYGYRLGPDTDRRINKVNFELSTAYKPKFTYIIDQHAKIIKP